MWREPHPRTATERFQLSREKAPAASAITSRPGGGGVGGGGGATTAATVPPAQRAPCAPRANGATRWRSNRPRMTRKARMNPTRPRPSCAPCCRNTCLRRGGRDLSPWLRATPGIATLFFALQGVGAGAVAHTRGTGARARSVVAHLFAPARQEPMQGVRGREHLPAPAHQGHMQAVRGRGALSAPAAEEPMQGVREREHLPASAREEVLQGVRGREHLPASAQEEQLQRVRGRGALPAPAPEDPMQGVRGREHRPASDVIHYNAICAPHHFCASNYL